MLNLLQNFKADNLNLIAFLQYGFELGFLRYHVDLPNDLSYNGRFAYNVLPNSWTAYRQFAKSSLTKPNVIQPTLQTMLSLTNPEGHRQTGVRQTVIVGEKS